MAGVFANSAHESLIVASGVERLWKFPFGFIEQDHTGGFGKGGSCFFDADGAFKFYVY